VIYAKHMNNQTDWPTTCEGRDGRPTPLNFTIKAFESKAERDTFLDKVWEKGENLIPCTRKNVEEYFGKCFASASDKVVVATPNNNSYFLEQYEAVLEENANYSGSWHEALPEGY